jgi:hypothetical protein
MNSNPKDRDRPLHEAIEPRHADSAKSADTWSRTGARRKDADRSSSRDPDLPTHVVGEHHTD